MELLVESKRRKIMFLKENLIRQLLETSVAAEINKIVDRYDQADHYGLETLFDFLKCSKKVPILGSVFFAILKEQEESYRERVIIIHLLQILYPILPKKVCVSIPEEMACDDSHLFAALKETTVPLNEFIIGKAKLNFFNPNNVARLLTLLKNDKRNLESLCFKMLRNRKQLTSQDGNWHKKILSGFHFLLSCWDFQAISDVLKQMLILGIPVHPIDGATSDFELARMLQNRESSPEKIMSFLADRMYSDIGLSPQYAKIILDGASHSRIFSAHIHIMVEIACALSKNELIALTTLSQDEQKNDHICIDNLWKQSEDLDAASRRSFALVLMKAIKQLLGERNVQRALHVRIPVNATPDSGRTRHPIPVEADTLMVSCS